MAFAPKTHAFNAHINKVSIGVGDSAVEIGGGNTLPFYTFDAPAENKQKIGIEITDLGISGWDAPERLASFYAGCGDAASMAKKAETVPGVSFICLHLVGADPNGQDRSVDDCVAAAKAAADATKLPICILGCGNAEKDTELFKSISEALQGKNILVLSAVEDNYKTVCLAVAMGGGHKIGAETAVDINLAKQMNVLISQLNVPDTSVVMNVGSAAAGYGYEYLSSTLDRVRDAALSQGDTQLQMPIVTPAGIDAWGVKEALASEEDMPGWGPREERGIQMEITTACADLASGSDAVILRHPDSVAAVSKFIDALVG